MITPQGDNTVTVYPPIKSHTTDDLIVLIDSGMFLAEIARQWHVDKSDLTNWIASDDQRSARARLARREQAAHWDQMAEAVLASLPDNAPKGAQLRARELASHYRWRASKINPGEYGDRITNVHEDSRSARELSTDELRIIAAGGLLPGGSEGT
jgi:hypothetical protein